MRNLVRISKINCHFRRIGSYLTKVLLIGLRQRRQYVASMYFFSLSDNFVMREYVNIISGNIIRGDPYTTISFPPGHR